MGFYEQAITWLASNDPIWVDESEEESLAHLSEAALLVADVFGKKPELVLQDVKAEMKRLGIDHKRNLYPV